MNPLKLVPDDDPILFRPCRSDFVFDLLLIDKMFNFLLSKNGLGLAAPQVGIDARLFVTRVFVCGWNLPTYFTRSTSTTPLTCFQPDIRGCILTVK